MLLIIYVKTIVINNVKVVYWKAMNETSVNA